MILSQISSVADSNSLSNSTLLEPEFPWEEIIDTLIETSQESALCLKDWRNGEGFLLTTLKNYFECVNPPNPAHNHDSNLHDFLK